MQHLRFLGAEVTPATWGYWDLIVDSPSYYDYCSQHFWLKNFYRGTDIYGERWPSFRVFTTLRYRIAINSVYSS